MSKKTIIRFGVIGCGLMGKEFASAAARWCHLSDVDFEPKVVAVCDANSAVTQWFEDNVPSLEAAYTDYKELLANPSVDAIFGCGARITEDSNSSTNLKLAMPLYQIFY